MFCNYHLLSKNILHMHFSNGGNKMIVKDELGISTVDNKFTKTVKQAVNDIRFPLACLLMLSKGVITYSSHEKTVIADRIMININSILLNLINVCEQSINAIENSCHNKIVVYEIIEKILIEKNLSIMVLL